MNAAHRADDLDELYSGEAFAADHPESETFRLGRDVLVAVLDGRIVAYAIGCVVERGGLLVGESSGEVHPDVRRRGLGHALWRATRDRLAGRLAADPRPGERELRSFAMDLELGAVALLAAEGYRAIRYGFEMRRALTGALPVIPLPHGLELRPVTPEQHRAIFNADNEAFRDHWGSRVLHDGDFIARFNGPDVDTSLWRVAWDGDEVAGVVMNAIFRAENEELGIRRGWLDRVSVRRTWRGRGLAKALCAASFQALREQGMDEAWLGVDARNPTGALGLYEAMGFTVVRRWQAYGRPVDGPAPVGWSSASG
jgi:ribosomal protein S18 acetylase RimI-like enzyme